MPGLFKCWFTKLCIVPLKIEGFRSQISENISGVTWSISKWNLEKISDKKGFTNLKGSCYKGEFFFSKEYRC